MNKLLLSLVTVAVATVTQAASIDWSINKSAWSLNNGDRATDGYTVYLINGATALDTIAAAIDSATGSFTAD